VVLGVIAIFLVGLASLSYWIDSGSRFWSDMFDVFTENRVFKSSGKRSC
jgi:hypothetical protein